MYRKNFVEGANLQGRSGNLYEVDTENQVNTDEYYNHKNLYDTMRNHFLLNFDFCFHI